MRNKFSATCQRCRQPVAISTGETNKVGDRWVTVHDTCPARNEYLYKPRAAPSYRDPELYGLTGRDYDDEFYSVHGMTQADYRDAVNPDEGDR